MATLELLKNWNLNFLEELDVKVQGSDERVISRKVVNTKQGKFLLEEVSFIKRKIKIAETLDYLSEKALSYVNPYLKTREGKFLCPFNSGFWQLSRYIDGWKLKRPDYLKESWRGVEAGKFLKKLWKIPVKQYDVFSVKDFIVVFLDKLKKNNPELVLNDVTKYLDDVGNLPLIFCHGDFHPLNIIWSEKSILKVIDWEFCGYKHKYYDSANFVGCLSFEHPDAIINEITIKFLRETGVRDFDIFFSAVIASRMIWLSNWLHKDDKEMVELEIEHLNLLLKTKDMIITTFKENV